MCLSRPAGGYDDTRRQLVTLPVGVSIDAYSICVSDKFPATMRVFPVEDSASRTADRHCLRAVHRAMPFIY